ARAARGLRMVAALAAVVVVLGVAASAAFAYPDPPPEPSVSPQIETRVGGTTVTRTTAGGLAFTGSDVVELAVIGGGLVGAGVVRVRLARRRTGSTAG